MGRHQFLTGKEFRWDGKLWKIRSLLPERRLNAELLETGSVEAFDLQLLENELFAGKLCFEGPKGSKRHSEDLDQENGEKKNEVRDLGTYREHLVEQAKRRELIIRPLLTLTKSQRSRKLIEAYVGYARNWNWEDVMNPKFPRRADQIVANILRNLENDDTEAAADDGSLNESQVQTPGPMTTEVLLLEMSNGSKAQGGKRLSEAVSVASIYRWIADYNNAGQDIRALISETKSRGGAGTYRLDDAVETIIDNVIGDKCHQRSQPTMVSLCDNVKKAIDAYNNTSFGPTLTVPSPSTIERRIAEGGLQWNLARRIGKKAAEEKLRQYGRASIPERILDEIEMDHAKLDLQGYDEQDNLLLGRVYLTCALDRKSRYPHGIYLGFEPPSYYSDMECLYHGIRPKGDVREKFGTKHDWLLYGLPGTLYTDNGRDFIGRDLEDACLQLGVKLVQEPVKSPWLRGKIERHFRTLNTGVIHRLPGTVYSNPAARGDYDSEGKACIGLQDLEKILHIFLLDHYAENKHRGLQGIPARRVEAELLQSFSPALPESDDELRILLGRVASRKVWTNGIEFRSIIYNCAELGTVRMALNGEEARIKYHPGDLSRLHVWNPLTEEYIEVPAVDQEYVQGLSLWKHEVILNYARKNGDQVDKAALMDARSRIQYLVDDAKNNRNKAAKNFRLGSRYDNAGKSPSLATGAGENDRIINGALASNPLPEPMPLVMPATLTNMGAIADGWEVG